MELKKVRIKDLKQTDYNPREITEYQLQRLKESITKFGYVEPLIVNKRTGNVVGGNQRLKVLKELKKDEVEVVYVDIPEIEEKTLNLALNRISGDWDEEKEIDNILRELREIDVQEDEFIEVSAYERAKAKTKIKTGDIFTLGEHRLMCGDSTKSEDVGLLMLDEKADMVFTDPPYGMFLNTDFSGMIGIGKGNKYSQVKGDNEDRKCRMMEIDPVYCQVIIDRWEKLTGKKALKVG